MRTSARYFDDWPIIHEERCHVRTVRFTAEHAIIDFADGRAMGVLLSWFPPIESANYHQRQNYISYGASVYWHDVDDGIDLTAMLTGMYIVPAYEREFRPQPHVPRTCIYLDDGDKRTSGGIESVPFVHDTRNIPGALRFTGDHLIVELADDRLLFLPLRFSPRLARANDNQRQNYRIEGLKLRWDELDEEIDLIAMLTGYYDLDKSHTEDVIEPASASTT